jgi:hypothetical protein
VVDRDGWHRDPESLVMLVGLLVVLEVVMKLLLLLLLLLRFIE